MLRRTGHLPITDRTGNLCPPGIASTLALPQVWRTNAGHRTTHCCSTPTPFSTTLGHYCGMKQLAHNSKPPHASPRTVLVRPAPGSIPTSRSRSHRFRISILAPIPSRAPPPLPCSARVRRASGFLLTAFSNARRQSSVLLHSARPGRTSEKALT
jgi:hypothetical protein